MCICNSVNAGLSFADETLNALSRRFVDSISGWKVLCPIR